MGLFTIVPVLQNIFTKKHSLAVLFFVCNMAASAQWEQKVMEDQWILSGSGGYVQNGSDKQLGLGLRSGGMTGDRLAGGALLAIEYTEHSNEKSRLVEFGPWLRYYLVNRGFGLFTGASLTFGLYNSTDEFGAEDEKLSGLIFGPDLGVNIFLSEKVSLELLMHYNALGQSDFDLRHPNINVRVGIAAFL